MTALTGKTGETCRNSTVTLCEKGNRQRKRLWQPEVITVETNTIDRAAQIFISLFHESDLEKAKSIIQQIGDADDDEHTIVHQLDAGILKL